MKEIIKPPQILILDIPTDISNRLLSITKDIDNGIVNLNDILDTIIDCCYSENEFDEHLEQVLNDLYIDNCGDVYNKYSEDTIVKTISVIHKVGIDICNLIKSLGLYRNGLFPYLLHPNTTVKTLVFTILPF